MSDEIRRAGDSPVGTEGEIKSEENAAPPDGLPMPRRVISAAAVLTAIVLAVLDGAIANVALPTISRVLDVTPSAAIWVVSSYQMALVIALLPCAALGESYGYRRVFTLGVVLFTLASALCALAPSLGWLIAARLLQGLGGAAIMALLAALLRLTYPRHMVGRAIGWNALAVALSAAAGPTLGATILTLADWPWLFAINIPVGLIVLACARYLPAHKGTGRPVDLISVALNAGFFAPLVVGVDYLTSSPLPGLALLAFAALSLILLIRREFDSPAPLIPLDLLRARPFRISVLASICCFVAQSAAIIALPFYIQHTLGQPAFKTGLYMTAWPLTVALVAPVSGRLADRVPTGLLCALGGTAFAAGLIGCALWPLQTHVGALIPMTMLAGLGFGFFQTPNNRNMLMAAPRARIGAAGGMQGTARLTGQTIGAVLMALLFTLAPVDIAPRFGLAIAAVLALSAGLISTLRIRA
nr:MFS transporter [uncultured Gellertiella sp.]